MLPRSVPTGSRSTESEALSHQARRLHSILSILRVETIT